MNRASYTAIAFAAATLAACGRSEPDPAPPPDAAESALAAVINVGALALAGDAITIRSPGHPQARIEAGGRLFVDGKEVAVTEAQRTGLEAYHTRAMQLREEARDTGIAGAQVGIAAAGAVIEGLAKGDASGIRPKVEAEAGKVKQAALEVCRSLAALRDTQETLAAGLEAFRPYATIDAEDVAKCSEGVEADGTAPGPAPEDAPPADEVPPGTEQPQLI